MVLITEAEPADYGRHHARCPRCGAWLCRYHSSSEDGGLCWPCAPGGEWGVVIEVETQRWERISIEGLMGAEVEAG